jgi:flagellar motility protein MotE (MotC chaperone)
MNNNHYGKRINLFTFLATLIAAFICYVPVSGWAADTDVKEEVKQAGAAIAEYSVEQKDAAVDKAKQMMDELDDRRQVWEGRLKEKWDNLKQSSKESYQNSTQELDRQREELAVWYEKMKDSSSDNWEEIKQGFADAYDSLASSWDKSVKDTGMND